MVRQQMPLQVLLDPLQGLQLQPRWLLAQAPLLPHHHSAVLHHTRMLALHAESAVWGLPHTVSHMFEWKPYQIMFVLLSYCRLEQFYSGQGCQDGASQRLAWQVRSPAEETGGSWVGIW